MFAPPNRPPYCQVQPNIHTIHWPIMFHITDISLHIFFLLLKLVMSWNPTLIWKSLLILSGRKPYVLNCKLSNTMTLGLLLQSQKARHWLVVDGYIKLSTIQMVLSRGTEPNWSQRASFSSKVLIIRIPFLPLPRLSQFTACLCWPQLMTGPFINWTSTMLKFTAIYLRKYMSSLPGLV